MAVVGATGVQEVKSKDMRKRLRPSLRGKREEEEKHKDSRTIGSADMETEALLERVVCIAVLNPKPKPCAKGRMKQESTAVLIVMGIAKSLFLALASSCHQRLLRERTPLPNFKYLIFLPFPVGI